MRRFDDRSSLRVLTPFTGGSPDTEEPHGRARLLAGRTIPGGIDASSIGDAIRPARSRALPHAVSEKSVLSSVDSFARLFFARSLRAIQGRNTGVSPFKVKLRSITLLEGEPGSTSSGNHLIVRADLD
jgi:hypothetical protein